MVVFERKDGQWFNAAQGVFFRDSPEGLIVEVDGDNMVMIKDWTQEKLHKEVKGRFSELVLRKAEWRMWPDGEYCP